MARQCESHGRANQLQSIDCCDSQTTSSNWQLQTEPPIDQHPARQLLLECHREPLGEPKGLVLFLNAQEQIANLLELLITHFSSTFR